MQKLTHILSIVLAALLVITVSSCNDQMTNQVDRVVDTGSEPTVEQPVTPSVEEPVTPPIETTEPTVEQPLPPLPDGIVVFVEPRRVTSPAAGQQLRVHINVKDAADVLAYEVKVGFDPTALRYVSIENADYLPAGAFAAPPQVTADNVYLAATSVAGPAAAANGTLATLTFEVIAAKASTITLSNVLLSDSNVTPLALTSVDGEVRAP